MKEVKFYKTASGKIVVALSNPSDALDEMRELKGNSTDGALEKHVPVVKKEGGKIIVDVGEVAHPMLDVHYIEFIALLSEERGLEVAFLKPGEAPHAEFAEVKGGVVYEYCNLHGLWKKEF